jgi:hypothetical protein
MTPGGGVGYSLQAVNGLLEVVKDIMVNAVTGAWSFNLAFYQAGGFQVFQVLADSRLRQGQDSDYFATDTAVNPFQVFNDLEADRVCQGLENTSQFFFFRVAAIIMRQGDLLLGCLIVKLR